jgi:hypothetical protein
MATRRTATRQENSHGENASGRPSAPGTRRQPEISSDRETPRSARPARPIGFGRIILFGHPCIWQAVAGRSRRTAAVIRLCDTILIKSAAAGISEALAFDLPQVPDI